MKTILIFDNYDSFTYNLTDLIMKSRPDYNVIVKRNRDIDILKIDYDVLVISPGPMTWKDTGILKELFEEKNIPKEIPTLGICLGMQFIAGYYGIKVDKIEKPVHGSQVEIEHLNDPFFKDIPNQFKSVRYNSLGIIDKTDQFKNIDFIAFEKNSGSVMALKHKNLPFVGLQYHPESFLSEYGDRTLNNFFKIYVEN
ncbi:MAG: aminodeoxychorismate/anthranilate synthase component II [Candidatus Delongbacteria bacterium]|nr:aminodeoxychorismate/anthranilate synthase component II [Candidatus Delongbacteria bacterium]